MLLAELKDNVANLNERSIEVDLGNVTLDGESRHIDITDVEGRNERFQFDELLERGFAQYLGISKSYLAKCPPDLKAHNVNHWLQANATKKAIIEAAGDRFINVHKPGLLILPLARVADTISNTLDPSFEVVNLIRNDTKFHLDIMTPHSVEIPTDNRIEDRTQGERAVGDITHGGIRIISNPTEVEAPQVLTYLHRLWCTNGSTSPEAEGTIQLKGNTIDDIFIEMEAACQRVMGDLDQKLADYAALAERQPPGSPTRFAYQLGREYGLGQRVMDRVIERVNILPEDATLYDIQQIFTQIANGNVNYRTSVRLQHLAGDMAFATDHITHRCGACERLLPEA